MELDHDYAVAIMLEVEKSAQPALDHYFQSTLYERDDDEGWLKYTYHCWLLGDAGYLKVRDLGSRTLSSPGIAACASPIHMTYAGHQWLDSVRNEDTRRQVLAQAASKGISLTLETLGTLGRELAMHTIRTGLGIG